MKNICLPFLTILLLSGCIKKYDGRLLTGRLLDECNGQPVANQTLSLYKDSEDNDIFIQDDLEELLQTTTTDASGYFTFNGEGYTDRKTTTITDASIRLTNGTKIAVGNLGQGRAYEEGGNGIKNTGNLYLSGMSVDINLHFGTKIVEGSDAGFEIEFVEINFEDPDTIVIVDTVINNLFSITHDTGKAFTKNLFKSDSENYGKFIYYIDIYYDYSNSNKGLERYTKLYLSQCIKGEDINLTPQ